MPVTPTTRPSVLCFFLFRNSDDGVWTRIGRDLLVWALTEGRGCFFETNSLARSWRSGQRLTFA